MAEVFAEKDCREGLMERNSFEKKKVISAIIYAFAMFIGVVSLSMAKGIADYLFSCDKNEKQNIEVVCMISADIPEKYYASLGVCAGAETKLLVNEQKLQAIVSEYESRSVANQNSDGAEDEESEYSNFAIANVDKYVNVRREPGTDAEIVGRMYDGAVAQIQDKKECEDGEWLEVISGNVKGFIKAEYFIYGDEAAKVIDDYVDRYALVNADRLNIRENPGTDSKRIGYANNGEKLKLSYSPEANEEWIYVCYSNDKKGYVSSEYVTVREEFIYAETMEEVKAKEEEEKARLEREKEDEAQTPEIIPTGDTAASDAAGNPEAAGNTSEAGNAAPAPNPATGNLRTDVVNFAMQYVGYPYVHGGNSLETGTDCSGFTSLVYSNFGIGLSRTPGGQLSSNGRSISLEEAQPGDIICYGHGKCTHVALYIGNGQIVHAANPRKGVVVYNVGYDNILGVKNVID